MKTCGLFAIYLLLLISAPRATAQEATLKLTNEDVIKMVQAGLSTDLIMARIKRAETDFDTSPSALAGLPQRGVPNQVLLAMLESDPLGSNTHLLRKNGKRITAAAFQQLQASVLTVWSEFGSGTGFIIDDAGLVLTSQHVVGPSEYIAVQFDKKRKIPAKLLASDPERDVAVLWINLETVPDANVAPLPDPELDDPSIAEGERVVTIGSPLHERRVFTTGIISKFDKRSITSDINLNRSDSGRPLFNSLGEAIGITTFMQPDVSGATVSGILRIEQTFPLLEEARKKMKRTSVPVARFLPVDPTESFPIDAIKTAATAKAFDVQRYSFDVGEYSVLLMTPTVRYRLATVDKPFEELRNWAGYVRGDKAVLFVYVAPRSGESRIDFDKMHLFCGAREVEPIHPAKVVRFVTEDDVTFRGIYAYSPTAISADCGTVTLEISSGGKPHKARSRELDRKMIVRVDEDFSPYYQKYGRPPLALLDHRAKPDKPSGKPIKWWELSKPPK